MNDLLKLAAGAGVGYIGMSLLSPKHRGFAGYTCDGHPCEHIPCEQAWHCQQQCHWSNDYTLSMTQSCDVMGKSPTYKPSDALQQGSQTYQDALKSTEDAFNSSLQFLGGLGMPVLIVGGLILAVVLIGK